MKNTRPAASPRGATRRAKELADIARTLHERKGVLAYGEFEKWALRAFPRYPIQVLRYLRKAHRTFGKELPRLLERLGQKKVFLLVGLDDPWGPIKDGIPQDGSRERVPLEQFSVSQLRLVIRLRNSTESQSRDGWGTLPASVARVSALWQQVQRHAPASTLRRDGARRQLERFRELLREVLGQVEAVMGGAAVKPAPKRAEKSAARPAARTPRDSSFLD